MLAVASLGPTTAGLEPQVRCVLDVAGRGFAQPPFGSTRTFKLYLALMILKLYCCSYVEQILMPLTLTFISIDKHNGVVLRTKLQSDFAN